MSAVLCALFSFCFANGTKQTLVSKGRTVDPYKIKNAMQGIKYDMKVKNDILPLVLDSIH